jgi:hypothetical protein
MQLRKVRDKVVNEPAISHFEDLWLNRLCIAHNSNTILERKEGNDLRIGDTQAC